MNNLKKLSDLLVKNNFKIIFGISGSGISYKFINELISRVLNIMMFLMNLLLLLLAAHTIFLIVIQKHCVFL